MIEIDYVSNRINLRMEGPTKIKFSIDFELTPQEIVDLCGALNAVQGETDAAFYLWDKVDDVRLKYNLSEPGNY